MWPVSRGIVSSCFYFPIIKSVLTLIPAVSYNLSRTLDESDLSILQKPNTVLTPIHTLFNSIMEKMLTSISVSILQESETTLTSIFTLLNLLSTLLSLIFRLFKTPLASTSRLFQPMIKDNMSSDFTSIKDAVRFNTYII